ncbi:MAG TPA: DoxX family protein [Kofleriaceae bacterium]|jgi:putative oxidoreductase|nr:DoxX family protein [Kofleriaceae bacterium]
MIDRGRLESWSYTALRFVAGFMFFWHGAQKVLGLLATKPPPELMSQMWFGGVIELVTGTLIALGLLTRPAAFLASGQMAVAYIQFHWKGALGASFLPIVNKGELAVLYCFVFLFICLRGAGPISIDRQLGRA